MARRRSNYGQEKRAKEIARKKKSEEKMKRRRKKGQEDLEAAPETEEKQAEG
ncbi:MAG: hypothetical protein AB1424_09575 [Thermodesulfobacteriota bacterium]